MVEPGESVGRVARIGWTGNKAQLPFEWLLYGISVRQELADSTYPLIALNPPPNVLVSKIRAAEMH